MASIKIVLRNKVNKDGTKPLAIRITKDRKTSFIHLGYHINEVEWDASEQRVKKTHPNSKRLNNFLIAKLAEANNTSLEFETQKREVSSLTLKRKIKPTSSSKFFAQADRYLKELQLAGKYNRYTPDKSRLKYFKEFLAVDDIAFSDITPAKLEDFKINLKSNTDIKASERTIVNYLMVIRAVFSYAIERDIIDKKCYPFGEGKMRIKFPESTKIGLSAEEVKLIEDVTLSPTSFEHHSRNLWLFAFYFAGMRISDVLRLKWSDFQNDRLYYTMGKNEKSVSLKIPSKALDIIAQYKVHKTKESDLIFPDLKCVLDLNDTFAVQRRISFVVNRVDKHLRTRVAPAAGITKKLTMHIARHTFGNLSGDKIPIQMLQKLYRHSSVTTTIGYQANFIHKDADDALDAVIGF